MAKKIMLLGSGELGKEFVIAAQRLGQTVVACDSYAGAPAMQVADACEVFPMLDGDALAGRGVPVRSEGCARRKGRGCAVRGGGGTRAGMRGTQEPGCARRVRGPVRAAPRAGA